MYLWRKTGIVKEVKILSLRKISRMKSRKRCEMGWICNRKIGSSERYVVRE